MSESIGSESAMRIIWESTGLEWHAAGANSGAQPKEDKK